MVHFYGVEGAEFNTEAATHADRRVNVELRATRDRFAAFIAVAHDPDTLRRTDLGAYAAGRAAVLIRFRVPDQHRDIAEALRQQPLFFRILDRQQPFLIDRLLDNAAIVAKLNTAPVAVGHTLPIVLKCLQSVLQSHAQTLKKSCPKHTLNS